GDPEFFFMRWKCEIPLADIKTFQQKFLNPILTDICKWYDWLTAPASKGEPHWTDPWGSDNDCHWQFPFGVYNPLTEGRVTDVDEFMASGSMVGLQQATTLFKELN